MLPLSVLLLARDEAARLDRLLPELAFAREVVVVVDMASRDDTRNEAERHGARVFTRALDGFGAQRAFALAQCREPWVLWIDADERLDPRAIDAIAGVAGNANAAAAGFTLERFGFFLGRRIRYCGWQGERVLRLFRRERARFDDAPVHERVHVDGAVVPLAGALEHHSYENWDACVDKLVRYAAVARSRRARLGAARGARRAAAATAALPAHVRAPTRRAGRRARAGAVCARRGAGVPQVRGPVGGSRGAARARRRWRVTEVCFFGAYDPEYPRNRILRAGLARAGMSVREARVPERRAWLRFPALAAAFGRDGIDSDVMLVPEFRHKDVPLARLLAGRRRLVFDPLVSRFDTLVDDWKKHAPGSLQASWNRLLDRVSMSLPDLVLCDTWAHGALFETLGVPRAKLRRVIVGAEDRSSQWGRPRVSPLRIVYVGGSCRHGV
jgi:(heptosyl)LPS beta-1,4-glucosyltransferase